jgi:hypothetical protein
MVFLNLHVEFDLKHTMVLQISFGVFWIERTKFMSATDAKTSVRNYTVLINFVYVLQVPIAVAARSNA